MRGTRIGRMAAMAGAIAWAVLAVCGPVQAEESARHRPRKSRHVPEVRTLLSALAVDEPRVYKNMIVFPIRYEGKQIPGDWQTLDEAIDAGHLRVLEKDQATVSQVRMENVSDQTIFLMSGEIIKGGKQTRVIRKDTVIEARQKVTVPVFCVEQHRWHGDKRFMSSKNLAPSSINAAIKRGEGQAGVWLKVREQSQAMGVQSRTESLDEVLESEHAQKEFDELHRSLGAFSPPQTIGIAVADMRSGRVIGLELFGRRDLFDNLQDKLVEGYASDVILASRGAGAPIREANITEKDVMRFIRKALSGRSTYEDTPGSGRGLDLKSGDLRGKGVAAGAGAVHLSIQRTHRPGVKPIVELPTPRPMPIPTRPRVR